MQSEQPTPTDATLTRDIQERIATQLRAMYNDYVAQDVPDNLKKLLQQLDKSDDEGKR